MEEGISVSGTAESGIASGVADAVATFAERVARRQACELVSVRYLTGERGWLLRVILDKVGGVDVEDCAAVSRQLSAILDVEDLVPHAYTLEVSSPGLDEFLLVAADYRRFAGRRVRIQTARSVRDQTLFRGTLRGLRRGAALLDDESCGAVEIPLDRVAEARLEVEI